MKKTLAISLILISLRAMADSSLGIFIGVNGGEDPYSNKAYFEDDLHQAILTFQTYHFQTHSLNAGGPEGLASNEINGQFERDSNGHLLLHRNKYAGGVATNANINQMLTNAEEENPSSVVVVLRDHGSKKGMSLWEGDRFSTDEIKKIDDDFPPSTLVRRIQLSCDSGYTIAPESEPKNFQDLLHAFPANRCGLSSTDLSAYSYDNPEFRIALKDPKVSLYQLKEKMNLWPKHLSSARLTSDFLETSLLQIACSKALPKNSCPVPSDLQQLKLESVCSSYFNATQLLEKWTQKTEDCKARLENLEQKKVNLLYSFLKIKYPSDYLLDSSYRKKRDFNKLAEQSGKSKLAITNAEEKAHAFILERRLGIDRMTGTDRNWDLIADPDVASYQSFLNQGCEEDRSKARKFVFENERYSTCDLQLLFSEVQNQYDESQNERVQLQLAADQLRSSYVEKILEAQPEPQLSERLQNIKKCEALPLSAKHP